MKWLPIMAFDFFFFFSSLGIKFLGFFPTKLGFLRGCLVCIFKQQFSVFKQHFTYFNALFYPHVFPQIFSNNNFQFLNICTKRAQVVEKGILWMIFFFLGVSVYFSRVSLSLEAFSIFFWCYKGRSLELPKEFGDSIFIW